MRNKKFQKGIIITQMTMIILTLLSLILGSNLFSEAQKNDMKVQLVSMLEREQQGLSAIIPNETEGSGTPIEPEEPIIQTESEIYYSGVKAEQDGQGFQVLPNGIRYVLDGRIQENNGFYSGMIISFENNYSFPINWLLAKNYVPVSYYDVPRMHKVYECEYGLYLYNKGEIDWNDPNYKVGCENFLNLSPDEQNQFNLDYLLLKGYKYF